MTDNTNDAVRGDSGPASSVRGDSNEVPKITSVEKTKDPRRVAAGKRLAAISKAAKEKKMRERIESEAADRELASLQGRCDTSWVRTGVIVGTLGVLVSGYSLYYRMKHNNPPLEKLEDSGPGDSVRGDPPKQNKQRPKGLDNLD